MMITRSLGVFLLFGAAHGALRADAPDSVWGTVDTVIVTGNDKTRSYVILDEMALRPGTPITPAAIEYDRNRIYSLGLFNNVDILLDTSAARTILFVDVHERWYILPVPLIGFRDGDFKKLYAGGGLLHSNFDGRNQKLFASVVFGYNPSLDLSLSDPLIDRERRLFFSTRTSFSRVRNRSEIAAAQGGEFDEKHYDIAATLGKRFSLTGSLAVTAGYQVVTVDEYRSGRTNSPTGKDHVPYLRVEAIHDARDLREYPTRGSFAAISATEYGFGSSGINHTRFGADLRRYFPLTADLTLAVRTHGTIVSGGAVPLYHHVYFGYGERLRGYFKSVFEGENMAGASAELRYPVLRARTVYVDLPLLPREFSAWRLGVGLSLFGDAGTTWFRGERLQFSRFASGYGAGIDIILPYSFVARLAFARNDALKDEFILDIRGAF